MISATDSARAADTSLRSANTSVAPSLKSSTIGPPVSGTCRLNRPGHVVARVIARGDACVPRRRSRTTGVPPIDNVAATCSGSVVASPQYTRYVANVRSSKSMRNRYESVTSLSPIERRSLRGSGVEARDLRLQQRRRRSERPQFFYRIGRVPGTNRDVGAEILEHEIHQTWLSGAGSRAARHSCDRQRRAGIDTRQYTAGCSRRPHPTPRVNRCRAQDLPCRRRKGRQHRQPALRPARYESQAGRTALRSQPA